MEPNRADTRNEVEMVKVLMQHSSDTTIHALYNNSSGLKSFNSIIYIILA